MGVRKNKISFKLLEQPLEIVFLFTHHDHLSRLKSSRLHCILRIRAEEMCRSIIDSILSLCAFYNKFGIMCFASTLDDGYLSNISAADSLKALLVDNFLFLCGAEHR